MISTRGYAADGPKSPLRPFSFQRREVGEKDVLIEILYCGICHSDIHTVRGEWGEANYPVVPGHEIVGRVSRTGKGVRKFKQGDPVGVGCFVDSCRTCRNCKAGLEQYCDHGPLFTYNSTDKNGKATYGGYSSQIVVDENYVLRIPAGLDLQGAAPLLCAGITTYSPLRRWRVEEGHRVGVLGFGGLGHMAVKLAASLKADVTVLSSSARKEGDARRFGARHFALTTGPTALEKWAKHFDFIIDTVSAPHDVDRYLELLKRDGVLIMVGASPEPIPVDMFSLIMGRRQLAGSLIGGIRETQEMLNHCAAHKITAEVEVIRMSQVNEAYDRVVKGLPRYRYVIDMKSL